MINNLTFKDNTLSFTKEVGDIVLKPRFILNNFVIESYKRGATDLALYDDQDRLLKNLANEEDSYEYQTTEGTVYYLTIHGDAFFLIEYKSIELEQVENDRHRTIKFKLTVTDKVPRVYVTIDREEIPDPVIIDGFSTSVQSPIQTGKSTLESIDLIDFYGETKFVKSHI